MNKYIDKLPTAPPIMVAQFQKLLCADIDVTIKPCSHKAYWHGKALYIPKDFYEYEVRDIALRSDEVSLYIDKNDLYEKIADSDELFEINDYYNSDAGKAYLKYVETFTTEKSE